MKRLIDKIEKIVNPKGEFGEHGECATGFSIGVNIPENKMRIILRRANGEAIAHMEFVSADAYGFTEHVLKGYDKLEGIK